MLPPAKDEVVPADAFRVAGQVLDLDDPADTAERPLGDDDAGDDRAGT